eukprot:5878504-Pyramimonas_sp.AAC.1
MQILSREVLAACVAGPVLNLFNPGFVNRVSAEFCSDGHQPVLTDGHQHQTLLTHLARCGTPKVWKPRQLSRSRRSLDVLPSEATSPCSHLLVVETQRAKLRIPWPNRLVVAGPNRGRGDRIHPPRAPIAKGRREYTHSGH